MPSNWLASITHACQHNDGCMRACLLQHALIIYLYTRLLSLESTRAVAAARASVVLSNLLKAFSLTACVMTVRAA